MWKDIYRLIETHPSFQIPETGSITFEDTHWAHQIDHIQQDGPNLDSKIGNVINMFNPKAEAQTSESTASSVASGSSDVINIIDKNVNIKDEITKEVDKLFGPTLERTRSGSDLELTAPLRHRRRQYKSQEVLPMDKTLQVYNTNMRKSFLCQSQEQINEKEETDKVKQVPILYDNQRAEIVASVTERLYSKLKKKEEAAVSKMETMMDKKIMEPLSELKICTNARQRLMELSQKAMRNKRRIGIPAHTQTRKMVTRVRDQGIDVQTDLEMYFITTAHSFTYRRDAATETTEMTPRCKEVAVGPKCGSLNFRDCSTITENNPVVRKNSFMMTDVVTNCERCTQTPIVPPPRRRKRAFNLPKYIKSDIKNRLYEFATSVPAISINISQQYPAESESQSSDDNLVAEVNKPVNVMMPPDLLTNHNTIENTIKDEEQDQPCIMENFQCQINEDSIIRNENLPKEELNRKDIEEFPDVEDLSLPRVTINPCNVINQEEMKDLILGRNENVYPYNIVLSPPREKDNTKRVVKFKDDASVQSVASQTSWEWEPNDNKLNFCSDASNSDKDLDLCNDSHENNNSDSTDCSKAETDSFIWKKGHQSSTASSLRRGYSPVYKSHTSKYKTARAKLYKEFLGLDKMEKDPCPRFLSLNVKDINSSESTENEQAQYKFRQRRQFFEDKLNRDYNARSEFSSLERNLLVSCNSLDTSVYQYEGYLDDYYSKVGRNSKASGRMPTEYLQHLVQLRREAIQADCDTDCSLSYNSK